jgi:hypothetical protein
LTKQAPRSHDWILREPLLTNHSDLMPLSSVLSVLKDFSLAAAFFSS